MLGHTRFRLEAPFSYFPFLSLFYLVSCHRKKLFPVSLDPSFYSDQMSDFWIEIPLPFRFRDTCCTEKFSTYFFCLLCFKDRSFHLLHNLIRLSTEFFASIFAKWFPPFFAPACMIMLHSPGNHTPDVIFHCPHIPVFQSFRRRRQIHLFLIGQESFPVCLELPDQFFHILDLFVLT